MCVAAPVSSLLSLKVPIHSIGPVTLIPTLTLTSVFFLPAFSYNLLSISALTSQTPCQVQFTHNSCVIQDVSKAVHIGMGRRFGNLYILDSIFPCNKSVSCNFVVSATTWHSRLGHPGVEKLRLLSPLLSIKNVINELCEVCPLSKQKHCSFTPSISHASSCFDLIYCDIWGPFSTISVDGYKSFLTIVDDHSRFVWIIYSKGEVGSILSQFFTQVSTKFNKNIKTLRYDNGP